MSCQNGQSFSFCRYKLIFYEKIIIIILKGKIIIIIC